MLKKSFLLFFMIISSTFLFAKEKEDIDMKKLSEAIGHIIGKNLDELGLELDIKRMIKGIKKGSLKKAPPMSEQECLESLAKIQQKLNEKVCDKNLSFAEKFLSENGKKPEINEIEKSKLQYTTTNEGEGKEIKSYNLPIVRYTGRYLDGKIFVSSEELISLNETIPGLKKGLIGMKKNEKRTFFIHPELAFGKNHPSLNSLIIFDVEIIKVDGKDTSIDLPKEIANENHTF